MRFQPILLLFLYVILSCLVPLQDAKAQDETLARVLKNREIRCAYTIYPPFFIKDPNTGKFSGMFYEFMEEMGKSLDIKVKWSEEVGSDNIFLGLDTGRYDGVCIGYFATPSRANGGSFTKPLVYLPVMYYVRADDKRFSKTADFNSSEVTVATMDGEFSQIFKNGYLPQAREFAFPALSQAAERFTAVAQGKADVTIAEVEIGQAYMKQNPGKLKQLDFPANVGGSVIIVPHGASELRNYLNTAIDNMMFSGALYRIIDKYQQYEGAFYPPALPYEAPTPKKDN